MPEHTRIRALQDNEQCVGTAVLWFLCTQIVPNLKQVCVGGRGQKAHAELNHISVTNATLMQTLPTKTNAVF